MSAQLPLRKIRATILRLLGRGHPYLEQVAERVGIEPRTLQRHLSAVGTSYEQLVFEVRYGLATKLLEDPRVPIASIASKAGFKLPSGFSRAFKAWTGMPPSQYRSQFTSGRREKRKSEERSSRDTYKYHFKVGNKIVHSGITIDVEMCEKWHQRRWPNGHIEQVGYRTTAGAARKWKETR